MSEPLVDERPRSYYGGLSEKWTCVFPGKMGISWKLAWNAYGTRGEAEAQAAKNCNVVAVPLALWLRYKEYEHRAVAAERKLANEFGVRLDYVGDEPDPDARIRFVEIKPTDEKSPVVWVRNEKTPVVLGEHEFFGPPRQDAWVDPLGKSEHVHEGRSEAELRAEGYVGVYVPTNRFSSRR
jgi:hypothetical protein